MGKSDDLFVSCGQFLSPFPGVIGIFLRRGYYWMTLDSFSRDCSVGFSTWFSHPQCKVGSRVYIGARCIIGLCDIGDDVLIGSNVDILSGRHQHHFKDDSRLIHEQGRTFTKVSIGRNAWIGNGAVIMADVGNGSVIGAGSVVVNQIPHGVIAAGNPAVVKRSYSATQKNTSYFYQGSKQMIWPTGWLYVALHPSASRGLAVAGGLPH